MRVLIADDDAVSRLILRRILTAAGHEAVPFADGVRAWEAFRLEQFPVVISDWVMPGVDGLELTRMIRAEARPQYTYVILLTALAGKGSYLEGMNAGADDFITKPFDEEQLLARLRVAERILGLQGEVKRLEGLLPTCSYCKKIRDAAGAWVPIERYIAARTDASFSHGICPECRETKVRPELERAKRMRGQAGEPTA